MRRVHARIILAVLTTVYIVAACFIRVGDTTNMYVARGHDELLIAATADVLIVFALVAVGVACALGLGLLIIFAIGKEDKS